MPADHDDGAEHRPVDAPRNIYRREDHLLKALPDLLADTLSPPNRQWTTARACFNGLTCGDGGVLVVDMGEVSGSWFVDQDEPVIRRPRGQRSGGGAV